MSGDGDTPITADGGTDGGGTADAQFVLTKVRLLLDNLAGPETNASFVTPDRADPDSIENSIRPPEAKWTWADSDEREKQAVSALDIGKYGLQTDIQKLFKLTSIAPIVWQRVRDFTVATWTWRDHVAREKEQVTNGDVGKIGYQTDIDSYFALEDATGPVWKRVVNPTSAPFELSTGASDAEAYHDFYRLQIAFEDVWAELIDETLGTTAQAFYAKWDTLMNEGMAYDLKNDASIPELESISSLITTVTTLIPLINPQIHAANPVLFNINTAQAQALIWSAVSTITQFNDKASKELKGAHGLDLQNIQAQLEAAGSRWSAFVAALGANAKPISDALDSALQILVDLKSALSQGAAERVASFGVIPAESIGGYDQLENFLNDVRIILGLPKVRASTSGPTEDYEPYFESISLDIRSAQDYADSFVFAYTKLTPLANQNQANRLSESIASSLKKGIDDSQILLNLASDSFRQLHGQDVGNVISKLQTALTNITNLAYGVTYGSITPDHINPNYTGTDPNPKVTEVTGPIADALTILQGLQSGYRTSSSLRQSGALESAVSDLKFPEIETLFKRLSDMLKERYRFDVFAPGSINYGLLLNYRQKWVPQSYQVGDLVKTIPLGAGEVQKYTTKTVVKKARNAKELDESLRSNKEDKSQTQRADAEIFSAANEKTDFNANASGTFKIGVYDVHADTHFGKDQGVDSKNTKRDQRESVSKSAQEYRDQHRMEVTTDTSREDETTSYRELRNPNDELTVTYLFYELQRRYLVSEALHRATPVILVANDVPAPHEIDQAWLVRYDWILKRAILDDSFLPALAYLAADYTGEEVTLITLEMAVQHQKSIVDKLSQQIMLANQSLNSATVGLTQYEDASVNDQRNKEYGKFVQSFFDPLGVGQAGTMDNGTSNRARLEFANQALQRAQAKVSDLTSQMTTEITALQTATDKYTAAATRHYGMLAEIDRLRLHVKDNIIHYMQAIWSHEPADQRYFRIYNLDVPVFEHNTTVTLEKISPQSETTNAKALIAAFDSAHTTVKVTLPNPELSKEKIKKLHQVADVDNLIGFKGNYMIFPLTDFDNYMTWYLLHNYIDFDTSGPYLSDPDPGAGLDSDCLKAAMKAIHERDPETFANNADKFVEVMVRLLSDEAEQMVIVPSDQLYIEALPGTHPILEDFKLRHRVLDVKKVQADVRHAELENLRLAARLASGEYGDPDIEKKIVIEGGRVPITVNPGD